MKKFEQACINSDIKTIRSMLRKGYVIEDFGWGWSLEYICMGSGSFDVIIEIINLLNLLSKNNINWGSGLRGACRKGNKELIHYFISHHNDIFYIWDFCLEGACQSDNIEIVQFIFDNYNINYTEIDWDIALHGAIKSGNVGMLGFIIQKSMTDVNEIRWSLGLPNACKSGNMDMVNYIVNKCYSSGIEPEWTYALAGALEFQNHNIIKFLMTKGIRYNYSKKYINFCLIEESINLYENILFEINDFIKM